MAEQPHRLRREALRIVGRQQAQPTVLRWPQFQAMFSEAHEQGEHIAIVGRNGMGKTLLGLELCKLIGAKKSANGRPNSVVVLQYKPRDDTLRKILPEKEWPIIKKWPPSYGQEHVIIWPQGGPPSTAARRQRAVFLPLLDIIYSEGGQTVYIPEAAYFERAMPAGLGMGGTMEQYWSTARALKLTLISDTQRPRQVTRLMWSEPAWLIIFRVHDDEDMKRVAELSGRRWEVLSAASRLQGHEFLCVRRQVRHEELIVSRVTVVARNSRGRR